MFLFMGMLSEYIPLVLLNEVFGVVRGCGGGKPPLLLMLINTKCSAKTSERRRVPSMHFFFATTKLTHGRRPTKVQNRTPVSLSKSRQTVRGRNKERTQQKGRVDTISPITV